MLLRSPHFFKFADVDAFLPRTSTIEATTCSNSYSLFISSVSAGVISGFSPEFLAHRSVKFVLNNSQKFLVEWLQDVCKVCFRLLWRQWFWVSVAVAVVQITSEILISRRRDAKSVILL